LESVRNFPNEQDVGNDVRGSDFTTYAERAVAITVMARSPDPALAEFWMMLRKRTIEINLG